MALLTAHYYKSDRVLSLLSDQLIAAMTFEAARFFGLPVAHGNNGAVFQMR